MRIALVLLMLLVSVASFGGPRLHLALEDRGDPNPRQLAVSATTLGMCAALIVSWSRR
ncbi:hypothetical protein GCM10007973_00220 [Polymorphobacter multimanifer]|uniref:Uncharacterized protein n=1 Tax=Polymorphobacter multimanifer TaxID=1070431 RepID=A0A841L2J4_9SPHN|nr:hypothetical protein [Polymorphobacter multimanifer]MBB6226814.1 hypothetical protein [Polymorphobacter multimanifer]GGI67063.1 hypothetical protein GCM10007973_00220 [Polymorphobacter multimanifer]